MDRETVTVDGVDYAIEGMPAKRRLHIARRLLPLVSGLLPHVEAIMKGKKDALMKRAGEFIPPIAEALSKMSDEDVDYIVDNCLRAVKRHQVESNAWAPVYNNGVMMFELSLPVMLRLTAEAVRVNLADFFPTVQPEESPDPTKT